MRRGALAAVLCLSLALSASAPAAPAQSPKPKTTVQDIEDEVMCPICGTLLELADSPQARREKVFVAGLVAEGKSKAEVKEALVTQYGSSVLAQPEAKGFDLTAYLVPVIAILVAIAVLAFSVAGWRRGRPGDRPPDDTATPPSGEAAERLDADLSRYDL